MELILVRHTKVEVSAGICYGKTDVDVSDSFDLEVGTIKKQLEGIVFNAIYSSPLKRCSLLADALFQRHTVRYDNRLKELDFGDWEGQLWRDIEKSEEAQPWFKDYIVQRCPNGESYQDVLNRVNQFLMELKNKHSNETILIVAHGGTIRAFLALLEKVEPLKTFEIKVGYGQIFKVEYL